jgi:hypothetical protein
MTDPIVNDPSAEAPSDSETAADKVARFEARLSRAEAQLRALTERMTELTQVERAKKQRALVVRLVLLVVLIGIVFFIQSRKGG